MNNMQMSTQHDLLEIAGSLLEKYDAGDTSAPGLLEEMTGKSGMTTVSGLNDYDYQSLSSLCLGQKVVSQIQTYNKVPIPSEILEHFKHIKCHCMMGLLPEIGRAWLTIDSEIYIWRYENSRDVAYYDGLSQLIVSVGLVKPKPGVFINDVKYLLILTTPIEVVILGVTFGDTTKTISPSHNIQSTAIFEEMQLMNKPIMVLSTDNVAMNVVYGSDNGRIFLGGRNGCLYEIFYQAESNWFGKRCKLVNHSQGIVSYMVPSFLKVFADNDSISRLAIDNSRQILYVLTEKGSIEVWDMSADSNSMHRITKLSYSDIAYSASNIIKTLDSSVFKNIKSICPLTRSDCQNLNLLAVTQCGVRLYFSTKPIFVQQQQQHQQGANMSGVPCSPMANMSPTQAARSPGAAGQGVDQKQGLYLVHIRLPPGYTPNTTINKPKQVHLSHYHEGTLLLVSTPQQDQDILWSISSAPFPHRPYLTESTTVLPLDGIVWSLSEMPNRCKLQSLLRNAQTPKKVVLLTNQGVYIMSLMKPVDILQQLLIACHGPHHEAVKAFFQSQGEREACATALLLACSEQYRDHEIAMWAAQAFLLYGGEPAYTAQMSMMGAAGGGGGAGGMMMAGAHDPRTNPQMFMSTPINRGIMRAGPGNNTGSNMPSPMQSQYPLSQIQDFSQLMHSAKHDGLYLYVARLLRPIWKMLCIDANANSTLSQSDCSFILEDLYAIRNFLEANSVNELSCSMSTYVNQSNYSNGYGTLLQQTHNQTAGMMTSDGGGGGVNAMEQAQTEEKRSLTALNQFIKHACEIIALWKILCEHQFHILIKQLPKDHQNLLAGCTFRDLILLHYESCAFLIQTLINSYLSDNATVSTISAKLRDVCPNLYRHEDAVSFKATEILMNSKSCTSLEEKQEKLLTALQLCKDAAPNLPLQNICQQFTLSQFYEGVIELSSTCAFKLDPEEFAIHYYASDEPEEDREGFAAYNARMSCYKEVRLMLDHVYQSICSTNANQKFAQHLVNKQECVNANAQIMKIVAMTMQVKDPLLHICAYEWLIQHEMLSELLSLTESSLGEFLRRNVVRNPNNLNLIDLLWKYYEKNDNHAQAARILDNLASSQGDTIPLDQRIEYLARAVMCMRNDCVGYSVKNGVLLKELEDKLEIARVQKTVLDAVTALACNSTEAQRACEHLNRALYDITYLYEQFADPFNLWECKLTILNCSHHNDPLLIESIWLEIIKKAVESTGSLSERSTLLFSKIESLYNEFGESGHCFPLAFIIRELEIKACQLHFLEGAVPNKLVLMNIDIELLMEYYSRMISLNERIWANEGNEWHLVHSSICLIQYLVNNINTIGSRFKRRVVGKSQDMISVCLNLCYQKPGTERMQSTLKELQCRLRRSLS